MKILHILSGYEQGGITTYIIELATQSANRGVNMDVLVLADNHIVTKFRANGLQVFTMRKRFSYDIFLPFRIAKFLRVNGYTILHSHSLGGNIYARLAAIISGVKLVTTVHSDIRMMRSITRHRSKALIAYYANMLGRRRTSAVIVVSEELYTKTILRDFPKAITFLVKNGITIDNNCGENQGQSADLQKLRDSLGISPTDGPVLITVGSMNDIKNQLLLLRAVPICLQKYPHMKLIIIGKGYKDAIVHEAANHVSTEDSVIMTGWVNNSLPYLELADVFVLTSRYEATSYSILEAMKCAKPILATRIGGIPETVEDGYNGLLFEDNNVYDLVDKLMKVVSDPELIKTMGHNSRRKLTLEYNSQMMAQKTIDVYDQISRSDG